MQSLHKNKGVENKETASAEVHEPEAVFDGATAMSDTCEDLQGQCEQKQSSTTSPKSDSKVGNVDTAYVSNLASDDNVKCVKGNSPNSGRNILSLDHDMDETPDDDSDVNTQQDLFSESPAHEVDISEYNDNAAMGEATAVDSEAVQGVHSGNGDGLNATDGQETGDFQCSRCFREFSEYLRYTSHIYDCQGPRRRYRCIHPGCCREYAQRSVMLQHHKSVHQLKPFLCTEDNCHHKYTSQKALKAHIHEHHKKSFKYLCKVCNQRFLNCSQYTIHLTWHTNIKPFGCLNCKKAAYSTAAQLNQHVAICLFGTQFRCVICGRNFATQTTLRQHIKNIHQQPGEFKCDLCPKVYKQYASLYKHGIQKHGN